MFKAQEEGQPVGKKLPTIYPDTLVLKKDFFTTPGNEIPVKLTFRRIRSQRGYFILNTQIRLVFLEDLKALEASFKALQTLAITSDMDYTEKKKIYSGYFEEIYGKTDINLLVTWLEEKGFL